jgi:prephenate dehydrogenase
MIPSPFVVIGPGLLGGSLLHDAKRLRVPQVRAWVRNAERAREILQQGLAEAAGSDLRELTKGARFVVLATPVGAGEEIAAELTRCALAPDAVVTDVGSVKLRVLDGAGRILQKAGISFVGSHPMAGSEAKGLGAAQPQLFRNAACIVTPDSATSASTLAVVREFWETLGCRVTQMDAAAHDALVARISHMPHVAAVAVTLAALRQDPSAAQFAAGGLRDTTRVASGDPAMWEEILTDNRVSVAQCVRHLQSALGEVLEILEKVEHGRLRSLLQQAKSLRDSRYAPPSQTP